MKAEDGLRVAADICRRVALGLSVLPVDEQLADTDIPALVATGREQRCLPMLAPVLGPRLPAAQARELEELAGAVWASHELTAATLGPVLEKAHAGGVRVIVYKGAAAAARFYREPWRRPMQDVDLLLEADGLRAVEGWLTAAGYRPLIHPGRARSVELSHERTMVSDHEGVRMVDLHLHPAPPLRHPFEPRHLFGRARAAKIFGAPALVLAAEDELIVAAVNQAYDHFRGSLLRAVDGALLMEGGEVEWDRLVQAAGEAQARAAAWATLRWMKALARAPVPESVLTALHPGPLRSLWLAALLGPADHPGPRWPLPRRLEQALLTFPLMDRPATFLSYLARHAGRRVVDARRARTNRS